MFVRTVLNILPEDRNGNDHENSCPGENSGIDSCLDGKSPDS